MKEWCNIPSTEVHSLVTMVHISQVPCPPFGRKDEHQHRIITCVKPTCSTLMSNSPWTFLPLNTFTLQGKIRMWRHKTWIFANVSCCDWQLTFQNPEDVPAQWKGDAKYLKWSKVVFFPQLQRSVLVLHTVVSVSAGDALVLGHFSPFEGTMQQQGKDK